MVTRSDILRAVAALFVLASPALAAEPYPEPQEWARELASAGQKPEAFTPGLVVAETSAGDLTFPVIEPEVLAGLLPFQVVSAADAGYSFKINRAMIEAGSLPAAWTENLVGLAAEAVDADLVLLTGDGADDWRVYGRQSDGGSQLLFKGRAPAHASATATAGFLRAALGYGAVVLDVRASFVLARTPNLRGQEGLSALAVLSSEKRLAVNQRRDEGLAILTLVTAGERYSVFRVVATNELESRLPAGTKIILAPSRPQ